MITALADLPRITYTSAPADLEPLHALFDQELPLFRARLGARWSNRIAGRADGEGTEYSAASPIDSSLALGTFVEASPAAVARAVAAARNGFERWGRTPWRERVALMKRFARELDRAKYELAMAVMYEVGKTRLEALGETEEAVALVEYYCDQITHRDGYVEPAWEGNAERSQTLLRPIGAFGVIAPFNYPVALAVNMTSAALIAGNTVVFKPSPNAGLTAGMLARVVESADLPPEVFHVVCGHEAGKHLVVAPGVDGIAFTGSHAVGMEILRTMGSGPYMRPVLAELGGKNTAYVSRSADLEIAVEGVAKSAFAMQAQKCTACSVAFVHASHLDAFLDKLQAKAKAARTGDPTLRETTNGPLINASALERYERAVQHAATAGRIVAGGRRLSGGIYDRGCYVEPAIVTDLCEDDWLLQEELFAPLLAVVPFDDLPEAIERGNRVRYGLSSGFYGQEQREIDVYLDRAAAGVQYVNRRTGATTGAWPGIQSFCGWKGSGLTGKGALGPHYLPQFMREQSRTIRVQ
jgi:1-pyrroline-5-carboxylate dehydrogenase